MGSLQRSQGLIEFVFRGLSSDVLQHVNERSRWIYCSTVHYKLLPQGKKGKNVIFNSSQLPLCSQLL